MGKRKSRKVIKKPNQGKVPTVFDCIFCNHEKSIFCHLDRKTAIGTLKCRMCSVKFQTDIHSLSKEIDVYSDWIDECEKVNRDIDKVRGHDEYEEDRRVQINEDDDQYRDLTKIDDEDDDLFRDLTDVGGSKKKKKKDVDVDEDLDDELELSPTPSSDQKSPSEEKGSNVIE